MQTVTHRRDSLSRAMARCGRLLELMETRPRWAEFIARDAASASQVRFARALLRRWAGRSGEAEWAGTPEEAEGVFDGLARVNARHMAFGGRSHDENAPREVTSPNPTVHEPPESAGGLEADGPPVRRRVPRLASTAQGGTTDAQR